jgi:two-component system LytT family response regulator
MSAALKVGIIEDEFLARETLRVFLEKHCEQVTVVFMATELESGVREIKEQRPDAIFLDIEMPGHSGMDILKLMGETPPPAIVFTTAYAEHAVEAFGLEAVDYLLKPIDLRKLRRAVDRVRERMEKTVAPKDARLAIPTSNGTLRVEMAHIIRLKAEGSYCEIHTTDRGRIMVSRKLKDVEEGLDPRMFLRIHRSHVVNLAHVAELIRSTQTLVRMADGTELPVARDRKEAVKAALGH